MAYLHIPNLYLDQNILLFKECFSMEKIHGTSAHIRWINTPASPNQLGFFSGGSPHENFVQLFDVTHLTSKFQEIGHPKVVIYGEAYGGKMQGMSKTYGPNLKFVAFEVKIGDVWLSVPQAEDICHKLGIEFVYYTKIPTTLEVINQERDADSIQAIRNGIGGGHMREGIVLRPLIEVTTNNGERVIAKHKRDEFKETKTPREVNPDKFQQLKDAQTIAEEWATPMRLQHVLQNFSNPTIENTGEVIKVMVEDILREGAQEVVDSKDARKAIGVLTAKLYKQYLQRSLVG